MEKILTVSIAAYNVEQYLEKTLESFVCDEYHMNKMEILIINDGSNDRTIEIAKKYEMNYPNTFIAVDKENGGYGSTINTSLRMAKGKYFRTVDGDDWVETESLGTYIDLLEESQSDIVVTKFTKVNDADGSYERVDDSIVYDGVEKGIEEVISRGFLSMHQSAYKTIFLKSIDLKITEKCFYTDLEYMLKPAIYLKTCICYDINVYMYRIGREGQSVQLKSWQKNIDQATKVTLNLCEYFEKVNVKSCSHSMFNYVRDCIIDSIQSKYRILLSLPGYRRARKKTIEFDKKLKNTSRLLYDLSKMNGEKKHSIIIRLSRAFNYSCMFIAYLIVRTKSR